jgi:DNA-binding response OmpR family regulator
MRLLNIGHSEDIMEMNRKALGIEKNDFETASDGRQALEILAKRLPDLIIITNFNMVPTNGREFLREFKQRTLGDYKESASIPILVTFGAGDDYGEELRHANVYALEKPYSINDLKQKVQGLLSN